MVRCELGRWLQPSSRSALETLWELGLAQRKSGRGNETRVDG